MVSRQFRIASATWRQLRRKLSLALSILCGVWIASAPIGAQSELPYSSTDSWFRPYQGPEIMQMQNAVPRQRIAPVVVASQKQAETLLAVDSWQRLTPQEPLN